MNFSKIRWPIYYIGKHNKIFTELNVTYIEQLPGIIKILDNKNLKGLTVGKRRLRVDNEDLYHFKRTLYTIGELVDFTRTKCNSDRNFCDNHGNIFKYKKNNIYKLKCFKIKDISRTETNIFISIYGSEYKFEVPSEYYNDEYNYVQVVDFGSYYLLYDLLYTEVKDTTRKL